MYAGNLNHPDVARLLRLVQAENFAPVNTNETAQLARRIIYQIHEGIWTTSRLLIEKENLKVHRSAELLDFASPDIVNQGQPPQGSERIQWRKIVKVADEEWMPMGAFTKSIFTLDCADLIDVVVNT